MTSPSTSSTAPASRTRTALRYVLMGAGLLLLAWLFTQIEWGQMTGALRNADHRWLGVALLATLVNMLLKAVRWRLMVRAGVGVPLSLGEAFWMVPVGVAAGALTPARTVDLGKPALMVVRHRAPFGRTVMLALWERLYDLVVLLLAGVAGGFLMGQAFPVWRWPTLLGLAAVMILLALVFSPQPLGSVVKVVGRFLPRLADPLDSLRSVVAARDPEDGKPSGAGVVRIRALGLSFLALLFEFVRLHAVAHALGFEGFWWVPPTIFALGSLAGLISLVPGGIGVSEWSQSALWSLLAPTFPHGAAVVLLDRVLSYYGLVFAGALVMVFTRRLPTSATLPTAEPVGDSAPGKVWWILPAYNEAANIEALLQAIAQTDLGRPISVILVDDGSTDGTTDLASEEAARCGVELIVKRHLVNLGLPTTLRDGLLAAAQLGSPEDVAICLDADNTHHPRWAVPLLSATDRGADVAICSRYQRGSEVRGVPLHRRVLSDGLNLMLRVFLPIPGVKDYTCGYRAYRVRSLQQAFRQYGNDLITSRSFACTAEVLLRLATLGVRVQEVPFTLRYDLKGGSSKMRIFATMSEYLRLIVRARLARTRREEGVVNPR